MLLPEPKPYKYKGLEAKRDARSDEKPTAPMMPKWFGASSVPCRDKLAKPPRVLLNGKDLRPLTVFNPEDRRIYNDISYPWGTIARF